MEIILLSNAKQSSKLSDQEQRLFSSQYLCLLGNNVSKKLSLHQIVSGPFCQSESGYTMPKTQEHCSNM